MGISIPAKTGMIHELDHVGFDHFGWVEISLYFQNLLPIGFTRYNWTHSEPHRGVMNKDEEPVVVEQSFDVEPETLWKALTEVELMRQWFFENIPSFRPEVGFQTQFNVASAERNFLHLWRIVEAVPMQRLAIHWKYADYSGDSIVVFEICQQNGSCQLKLTHRVLERFPDTIPEFRRESCLGGWQYFIQQRLKAFFEKQR